MKLTMINQAGPNERIAPHALDSNIGKTIPVRLEDGRSLTGKIVDAVVADDGQSYEITVEIPERVDADTVTRFGSVYVR